MKGEGESTGGTLKEERKRARMLPGIGYLRIPLSTQSPVPRPGFSDTLWKRAGETS